MGGAVGAGPPILHTATLDDTHNRRIGTRNDREVGV